MLDLILVRPRVVTPLGTLPPRVQPPDPIAYLAGYLLKFGYTVKIKDLLVEDYDNVEIVGNRKINGLSDVMAVDRILALNPLAVGINFEFWTDTLSVKLLVESLRKAGYKGAIILGGTNASALNRQILGDSDFEQEKILGVDIVVNNRNVGGGEYSLEKLLYCLKEVSNLREVPGISYKEEDKVITTNSLTLEEVGGVVKEITGPARHLYPRKDGMDIYSYYNNPFSGPVKFLPFASLFTSRGCPYNCGFCLEGKDTPGFVKGWMRRSCEKIFREIDLLAKEGIKTILIQDENFGGYQPNHLEEACNILDYIAQKRIKAIYFPNAVNVQSMIMDDFKLLRKLKNLVEMGLTIRLAVPVESGSDSVLKIMEKPHSINMLNKVFYFVEKEGLLRRESFELEAWAMVGYPGESFGQAGKTIKYMAALAKRFPRIEPAVFYFQPVPGIIAYEGRDIPPEPQLESQPPNGKLKGLVERYNRKVKDRFKRPNFKPMDF
ncbi:MAG: radical SAM protein [Patescibacteria group bacterium]|nr:radical SAM protein [Patescibacteria group bacterium]MDD5294348.1 radical SAM protein [Patescibacteria group bacterium]MDD5554035.1 radical SAM protein [Patescibacteria group bacterium]